MKLVSVIIPAFNAARYLPATLQTVIRQDYENLEIIVIDDGSTDGTPEILDSLTDPRLRFIGTENSGGPSRPRNIGIRAAKGDYVCFCDADDLKCKGKIARQMRQISREPDLGLVFSDYGVIDDKGNQLRRSAVAQHSFLDRIASRPTADGFRFHGTSAYRWLMRANYIGTSSVVMPRRILAKVGGFDETLFAAEDIDLWYRVARNYDIGFFPAVLHHYRRHAGSISCQNARRQMDSRIEVNRRLLSQELTSTMRRDIERKMASLLRAHAYHWERQGDHRLARRCYLDSLRKSPSRSALRGVIKTWAPPAVLRRLRKGCQRRHTDLPEQDPR